MHVVDKISRLKVESAFEVLTKARALETQGRNVIHLEIAKPGFPIYESMIRFMGATPVPIPLVESREFSFDLNEFREKLSNKTKLIILNSPANPAGSVIPKADLVEMAAMIREKDVMVLSDEIY